MRIRYTSFKSLAFLSTVPLVTMGETVTEYTSMSKAEQIAFSEVATNCANDVKRFCEIHDENSVVSIDSPLRRTVEDHAAEPDPFTVFNEFHRQAIEEFDSFVETFMRPHAEWVVVYDSRNPAIRSPCAHKRAMEEEAMKRAMEDEAMKGLLSFGSFTDATEDSNFFQRITSNIVAEDFDVVGERLQAHGNELLTNDNIALTETGRRMARRLQEITTDELKAYSTAFLPFGEHNKCLDTVFRGYGEPDRFVARVGDRVSPKCFDSLMSLQNLRYKDMARKEREERAEMDMFFSIAQLYLCTSLAVMILAWRRRKQVKRDLRLMMLIMTTVYSNPALKRDIELKLGESVGSVPPLPPHVLALRGRSGKVVRSLRRYIVAVRIIIILSLCIYCAFDPLRALSIAAFMAMMSCWSALFMDKPKEPICTCCCCGTTTEDAQNGLVTKEQMCCNCCQGTGVCKPECASCCGPKDSKACALFMDKPKDPICTCCCCGTTTEDAKNGLVTKEQMCCNCCQGTGVCKPECASCCGPKDSKACPSGNSTCCCETDDKVDEEVAIHLSYKLLREEVEVQVV